MMLTAPPIDGDRGCFFALDAPAVPLPGAISIPPGGLEAASRDGGRDARARTAEAKHS